ncbi:cytochrome c family protein [Tropicimonas sp. IMCC34043]|uniref:c-type cytochrome n=1 Tax=Tropicimonas sp. IMCC34043 TaxID=2248760 RepID=UPI000E21C7C2|nr:c-type cytochrome [Tropicimonas sp. IMCC34043]
MIRSLTATATAILTGLLAVPAAAQDVDAGAEVFKKQCATCHVVVNPDGETLAGRKARTGPNLYGVIGGPAAQVEGFRYGDGIQKAAEMELVWNEENLAAYLQDTSGFLETFTGDDSVRSKMSWKVKKEEDAANVHAFLISLNPPE